MPLPNIPYPHTLDTVHNPPWHMDAMHIQQLYRLCERIRPKAVVEIGSYMGASTSAFVEAVNDGYAKELTCYDIKVQHELNAVLNHGMVFGRVGVSQTPYPQNPIPADLILIDGDHGWPALADLAAALAMGIPHIVLHDTMGHYGCHGSKLAADILRASPYYVTHEDNRERAGLFTHRGMMYARSVKATSGLDAWEELP